MTRHRLRAAGTVVLLAVTAAGCGSEDSADPAVTSAPDTTSTTEAVPTAELPPPGALDLEALYAASLADLGLQLTDRGGLIDRSGGGYEPSAVGRHLALYVEPIGDRTVAEYIEGIRTVAVVFADVFERWPGLESFDVCQEPVADGTEEPGTEPLPVTQIELTREESAEFDWDTVTVVELVRSSRADPPGVALRVSTQLIKDPAFEAIAEEAS